jgi:polysaccharide biosynthesis protein PslH
MTTDPPSRPQTVIIVGPPWPHSGTARLMQNQVEYYRSRGFRTIFLCIPIHCSYTEEYSEWGQIKAGMQEIGADEIYFAPINRQRFLREKYVAWLRHAFRGNALDWIVFTSGTGEIPKEIVRRIRALDIAAIHVNHVFTMGFVLRMFGGRHPLILETHDIQADLLAERGEINPWSHRRDKVERLLRSELLLLDMAKVLVHCSVDDMAFFKKCLPKKEHVLALPTIDESFVDSVRSCHTSRPPIDLLFVGQSTWPNLDAMEWLFTNAWPLLADRGYRIAIVGKVEMMVRNHLPEIHRRFGELFLGQVDDLAPYYAASRCIIAPMVSGTGISIKTVEALALGKPFVGMTKAFRGIPADILKECGIEPHDTAQSFVCAIERALSDGKAGSEASRRAYQAMFSAKAIYSARDTAFNVVASLHRTRSIDALQRTVKAPE